jgi:hypothetical protein
LRVKKNVGKALVYLYKGKGPKWNFDWTISKFMLLGLPTQQLHTYQLLKSKDKYKLLLLVYWLDVILYLNRWPIERRQILLYFIWISLMTLMDHQSITKLINL